MPCVLTLTGDVRFGFALSLGGGAGDRDCSVPGVADACAKALAFSGEPREVPAGSEVLALTGGQCGDSSPFYGVWPGLTNFQAICSWPVTSPSISYQAPMFR